MAAFLVLSVLSYPCRNLYPQDLSYDYLIQLGGNFLEKEDYSQALHYFRLAQVVNSSSKEAIYYINLIKRDLEGRVISSEEINNLSAEIIIKKKQDIIKEMEAENRRKEKIVRDILDSLEKEIASWERIEEKRKLTKTEERKKEEKKIELKKALEEKKQIKMGRKKRSMVQLDIEDKGEIEKSLDSIKDIKELKESIKREGKEKKNIIPKQKDPVRKKDKEMGRKKKGIYSTAELDKKEPLVIELSPEEFVVIKSESGIKRFLIVTPDKISVEKIDNSSLKISGDKFGSTFLHVWDGKGRSTFNVKVVFPHIFLARKHKNWEDVKGFRFEYNSNWWQYYRGSKATTLERRSLGFNDSANISGSTPYGDVRASLNWARLGKKKELTGYSASLSDGHLGKFDDFSFRLFDINPSFSPLTLSGKSLHGVVFDSPAFNNKLTYKLIYGKERPSYYGFISPGVFADIDSYIEGVRVGLFPMKEHNFFINYAQAHGSGRQDYLSDRVFSVQTKSRLGKLSLSSEIASDADKIAARVFSSYSIPKLNLSGSFYNTEKGFTTVTGRSSGRGRIGGRVGASWRPMDKLSLSSGLNVYKDRFLFNADNPDALNYDWNGSLSYTIDPNSSISSSLYYMNTEGLSSPQRSLSSNSTYNKQFKLNLFGKRNISTYLSYNYQKSINPLSPSSDYRRDGLSSGFSLKLAKGLSYFLRYNYSKVKDLHDEDESYTSVRSTGMRFSHSYSPKISSSMSISYRDEERGGTRHSFLTGQDSLEGTLSLSYNPNKDAKFFLSGRLRNVWIDNSDDGDFVEADFRVGTNLSWDSFFRWAPRTTIKGRVFNDVNANGIREEGEEAVSGVKISVGPKEVTSDENGLFETRVQRKSLVASIDFLTIPEKYILTTASSYKLDTSHGGVKEINFGLSMQSGAYGVVFYDVNDDGKLDRNDLPIRGVKILLNARRSAVTNSKGVYFFPNIMVGKHTLTIDVNSLPLEYLPKISIRKSIEVIEGVTYSHHIPLRKRD